MNVREMHQRADERRRDAVAGSLLSAAELPERPPRTPLTASQHILHLLLTVFTAGLWAPVWFWRSVQGNRGR